MAGVHCSTDPELAGWHPECRQQSLSPKERVRTTPRDVRIGPDRPLLLWHKRKWHCRVPECERKVFIECRRPSREATPTADPRRSSNRGRGHRPGLRPPPPSVHRSGRRIRLPRNACGEQRRGPHQGGWRHPTCLTVTDLEAATATLRSKGAEPIRRAAVCHATADDGGHANEMPGVRTEGFRPSKQ